MPEFNPVDVITVRYIDPWIIEIEHSVTKQKFQLVEEQIPDLIKALRNPKGFATP